MIATRTALVFLLLVAALGVPVSGAGAEVYRYVDEEGNSHFSDSLESIPPRYRDQVANISDELRNQPGVNVIPGLNQPEQDTGDGVDTGLGGDGLSSTSDSEVGGGQATGGAFEQLWARFGPLLLVGVLLFVVVAFLIAAALLMLACKLAAPETPGFGRACAVVFVQGLVGMALNGVTAGVGLAVGVSQNALGLNLVATLACLAAYAGVLSAMTDLEFLRAVWVTLVAWLLAILIVVGPIALVVFVALI